MSKKKEDLEGPPKAASVGIAGLRELRENSTLALMPFVFKAV